jgi:hypothetical protein
MPWIRDGSQGEKIPRNDYDNIRARLEEYASKRPWGASHKLVIHFKGQFCYIGDDEGQGVVSPLCRLRYIGKERWSAAFYSYSNDKYEACILPRGSWIGPIEEAFSVCEVYLT